MTLEKHNNVVNWLKALQHTSPNELLQPWLVKWNRMRKYLLYFFLNTWSYYFPLNLSGQRKIQKDSENEMHVRNRCLYSRSVRWSLRRTEHHPASQAWLFSWSLIYEQDGRNSTAIASGCFHSKSSISDWGSISCFKSPVPQEQQTEPGRFEELSFSLDLLSDYEDSVSLNGNWCEANDSLWHNLNTQVNRKLWSSLHPCNLQSGF